MGEGKNNFNKKLTNSAMIKTKSQPKSNRFSAAKKTLVLSLIVITSFSSMSFRSCNVKGIPAIFHIQSICDVNKPFGLDNSAVDSTFAIYVGENGGILRTSGDANIVFEQIPSGTTERLNNVRASSSTSNGFVFAVGNQGTVIRSTNTGNDWVVATPVTTADLYCSDFRSGGFCYAVGDNGTILLSVTNGDTWNAVTSGTIRNLKAVAISQLSVLNVVAAGEKGTIIRSTDGGSNWTNVSISDTTITFYDISKRGIYYNTGNSFCIVGTGGRIYKSTDNGATWQQKPSGTTNTLRSIYFHTVDSAVVAGDNGTIRFTADGGETWFSDAFFNSPLARQYNSVSLVNRGHKTYSAISDTIWFVSNDPITIGLNPVSSVVPTGYSLSQNYPNPFNPSTNIKFSVPKSSAVKLIVYDINGREVEILVNESLSTGTYRADWNASKYSSGVYFYKLTAGDFTETKSMVLIK